MDSLCKIRSDVGFSVLVTPKFRVDMKNKLQPSMKGLGFRI